MRVTRGTDAPFDPLRHQTVAVLGYGNQGQAHALNLRDSGASVVIGSRPGSLTGLAAADAGFEVLPLPEATARADLVILALPDEAQPEVFAASIRPHLRPETVVGFLHGFAIRYDLVTVPDGTGVIMVAPKGPGHALRARFVEGLGLPSLFAVHQPSAQVDETALGLAWAAGIGSARAGIIHTTFADETETDLFGEQVVLCGGLTELILVAFELLVEAGYPPELAYTECCHEVKQIADLFHERGLAGMFEAISNTAEFGAYRVGPRVIDETARERMREVLAEVRDGRFARAMRDDYDGGFEWFIAARARIREHPIEPAGDAVRALMPWLGRPPATPEKPNSDAEAPNDR